MKRLPDSDSSWLRLFITIAGFLVLTSVYTSNANLSQSCFVIQYGLYWTCFSWEVAGELIYNKPDFTDLQKVYYIGSLARD